jgi:hypothetical protein
MRDEVYQPVCCFSFRSILSVVDRTPAWKLRQSSLTTSQLTIGALPPAALAVSPLLARPVVESYFVNAEDGHGHSENKTKQDWHGEPPSQAKMRTMQRTAAVIVPCRALS